jgi:hypothetical protein
METTANTAIEDPTSFARQQMADAVALAAAKVKKSPKVETAPECFQRIRAEKQAKENKSVKRASKVLVKKKKIKKMTSYFSKK